MLSWNEAGFWGLLKENPAVQQPLNDFSGEIAVS
jgi:hypothetical protein